MSSSRKTTTDTVAPTGATPGEARHVRVAIVGTGFSGLGMAIRLKQQGIDDFVVLERADDIGGTWRDNTYPGCACDVPSHLYSFSFAPNPDWSRSYSPQQEIWEYLRHCAKLYGVIPHIQFNTEVQSAAWDEIDQRWRITTTAESLTADLFVLGNGPLSEPRLPDIPGLDTFAGTRFHSAQWDHAHDLSGERVAVIGTGASAIQFVPQIQPRVGHLALFQRTPPWILPRKDQAISEQDKARFRALPLAQRLARARIYLRNELTALFMVYKPDMMKKAEQLSLHHLEKQIADLELRAKLTPTYTMGCKRILLSDDFYPALTQDNVEVVNDRIAEVRPHSIVTADGVERPVDTIIIATGFHVTDMPAAGYVRGSGGRTLADVWRDSPQAYLGATVAGFPNLFLMIGPNTGLGHTSMVYMIESQLTYVLDCLKLMERRGVKTVEVRPEVQQAYNDAIQRRLQGTVWLSGCKSWYLDAHGRNTTLWPGFTFEYRWRTHRFDTASYELSPVRVPSDAVSSVVG